MSQVIIRQIEESDVEDFIAIRRQALEADPFAFLASPESDVGLDSEFLKNAIRGRSTQAVLGAWADTGDLVGIVGIYRYSKEKEAHKAGIWGMYVDRSYRRQGVGSSLLSAAIEFASSMNGVIQINLSVSGTSKAAVALYERKGFVAWGTEQNAILIDGRYDSITHMFLDLNEIKA